MDESVKCLSGMGKDLRSVPSVTWKEGHRGSTYNPSLGETETVGSQGLLASQPSKNLKPSGSLSPELR